ncbi:MAG: GH3 auxin-responsive promoter family protein [Bacteroidales bacterium]|nr:GH3 auxin-responsive promoter family protein [Bacteroidales bacterium]
MAIVGSILKELVHRKANNSNKPANVHPHKVQTETLKYLLEKAQNTEFGNRYNFQLIAHSSDPVGTFQKNVKLYNYISMQDEFWHKALNGVEDVCWPGKIKYFGLTSGTSDSASKRVPVTTEMIKAIRRVAIKQILSLHQYDLPSSFFNKKILMLGGSISLNYSDGHFEGDLSGILAGNFPSWFNSFYKPGAKIAKIKDWEEKLNKIVTLAPKWDVGCVAGVPAWVQILMEKIIEKYNVKSIHDIWPNLYFYSHGGVSFKPYERTFKNLLGHPIEYLETYLASEGFIAYQNGKADGMDLVLDNGMFYEFVPFNSNNFESDGELKPNAQALTLNEVNKETEYAILLSTCAGAWRYLIGDTVKFISLNPPRIVITGRTKHFLSLCGEHMSVDNMDSAIKEVSDKYNLNINEYTVAGKKIDTLFAHKWYIGTDKTDISADIVRTELDKCIKRLNDDYSTERKAALKDVIVVLIPNQYFYEWMALKGKAGGQNKFPRVLKKDMLEDWEKFIEGKGIEG